MLTFGRIRHSVTQQLPQQLCKVILTGQRSPDPERSVNKQQIALNLTAYVQSDRNKEKLCCLSGGGAFRTWQHLRFFTIPSLQSMIKCIKRYHLKGRVIYSLACNDPLSS